MVNYKSNFFYEKAASAGKNLPCLQSAFSMAQKMGALLGGGGLLQRPLPEEQDKGGDSWRAKAVQAEGLLKRVQGFEWRLVRLDKSINPGTVSSSPQRRQSGGPGKMAKCGAPPPCDSHRYRQSGFHPGHSMPLRGIHPEVLPQNYAPRTGYHWWHQKDRAHAPSC